MQLALRVSPQQTNWRSPPHTYVQQTLALEGVTEMLCVCVHMCCVIFHNVIIITVIITLQNLFIVSPGV